MDVKQSFMLAIKSILSSKMRSFLTMLGIIIGVSAVIILVSLINGFSQDMSESFEAMGTNLISVMIPGRGGNISVSATDIQKLAESNTDVIACQSPVVTVNGATVKYGENNTDTTSISGVNEYYGEIKNYSVSSGRFLSYVDVEKRLKVCLIGTYIQSELFGTTDPLGKTIKINGNSFTVIGILTAKSTGEASTDDDVILMPYNAATRLSKNARVTSYVFSAATKETVDAAMEVLDKYLLTIFYSDNYYRVYNQQDSLEQVNELSGTLTLVLVGVAAISLLVGGIGIMNIMLVSVTERTKEIGIRKSLGGKRRDIMRQFVIEAATTSALGGVVGIVFGCAAAYGAGKLLDMSAAISFGAIAIAFSVSVGIGIIFGYFPASKAAKLNPIEALRYD